MKLLRNLTLTGILGFSSVVSAQDTTRIQKIVEATKIVSSLRDLAERCGEKGVTLSDDSRPDYVSYELKDENGNVIFTYYTARYTVDKKHIIPPTFEFKDVSYSPSTHVVFEETAPNKMIYFPDIDIELKTLKKIQERVIPNCQNLKS